MTSEIKDIDGLMRLSGRMECESPNRHLYEFVGNLRLDGHRYETRCGHIFSTLMKCISSSCNINEAGSALYRVVVDQILMIE